MLASLPTLDMAGLTTLFDDQLLTCLPSMTKDREMAKLVLAVMRRETQLAVQTTIQDKVAKVSSLVKSLVGCDLLDNCFKMFSGQKKCSIAEQLLHLWQLGSSLFISALPYMEEAALASIACSLSNQYTMLATNIKYVATLYSFFTRIRYSNLTRQVLGEVEEQLVTLSYDKNGYQLMEVFLEHGHTDVQEQVVISLSSQVVELFDLYGAVCHYGSLSGVNTQHMPSIARRISGTISMTHRVPEGESQDGDYVLFYKRRRRTTLLLQCPTVPFAA